MVTGANTTDYLLDGQSVVREIKNGVIDATYLIGPRGPEYKRDQNGVVSWYLYDGLGSVVGLVDSSGNVTNTRKYDVYGAPRNAQTGSAHCFVGSLGHTSDAETGLIYMRARYMDPATGRFASEDRNRDGRNWFVYCANNPVNGRDRTGEEVDFNTLGGIIMSITALALLTAYCKFLRPVVVGFLAGILVDSVFIREATGNPTADKTLGTAIALLLGSIGGYRSPGDLSWPDTVKELKKDPVGQITAFWTGYTITLGLTMAIMEYEY